MLCIYTWLYSAQYDEWLFANGNEYPTAITINSYQDIKFFFYIINVFIIINNLL